MPDYIYLLENRLSADQQNALSKLREAAREAGTILFLTGDAVRELTSGHAVRDLEVAVHGNALKLKKTIVKLGGSVWGENEDSHALYLCFPGTARVDLVSTYRVEYPKPGKPVYHAASILEDLRHRDFTVNAMAISLNEGSFGLLMDPMNGAADIESRTLRLVSNYGFLEDPSLLIRATRYIARLGWEMDPRTHTRYLNAKEEGVIEHLSVQARGRELEQIGHEDEGLKVLRALDAEGWMEVLFPAWTSAKADEEGLAALHDLAVELFIQGVHADISAAQMQLLTAKLTHKELAALKKLMLRPGFVEEWDNLDALAAGFAKALLAKENATPSISFKLFTSFDPEAILWLGFTSKNVAVKERFNLFLKVWPEVRQRIPYVLMQEMRITAELPAYDDIVQAVFLELLDGKLATPEETRAFLEPYSPPAPLAPVTIKRSRAKRGSEAKLKEHSFEDEESEGGVEDDEDLDEIGGEDDDLDMSLHLPKVDLDIDLSDESEAVTAEDEEEDEDVSSKPASKPAPVKRVPKSPAQAKVAKTNLQSAAAPQKQKKPAGGSAKPKHEVKHESAPAPKIKTSPKRESKPTRVKAAPARAKKEAPQAKPVPKKLSTKAPAKSPVRAAQKASARTQVKTSANAQPKASAKAAALKPAHAKTKPVSVRSPKLAKGNKPSRPTVKKIVSKSAKKR
jgi:tRNA nucleotidyltransferase/poly(A) polymerase